MAGLQGQRAVVVPVVRQLKINYRTHNGILKPAAAIVDLIQVPSARSGGHTGPRRDEQPAFIRNGYLNTGLIWARLASKCIK